MKIIEPRPEHFALVDLLHIERWMCSNCGLILDYQFQVGEVGWPKFDPPLSAVYEWTDEEGDHHFEEPERGELCPRCNVSFEKIPLIPIIVREAQKLADFMKEGEGEGETLELKENFSRDK